MEKISRVVRGNSRVAATDLKNAAPVRPGAPSFGRPIGESTSANPGSGTTASRAVALHNEMQETKKQNTQSRIVQDMADKFFLSRGREAEDEVAAKPPDGVVPVKASPVESEGDEVAIEIEQPAGYKPRGSFVDVRA